VGRLLNQAVEMRGLVEPLAGLSGVGNAREFDWKPGARSLVNQILGEVVGVVHRDRHGRVQKTHASRQRAFLIAADQGRN
jgi:hypothetical protein